uniref:Uncharacterized protein n=1 Tax=viral metagenome TaxID=1070528 RepID=A0A6C0BFE2_9ZZZZ
MLDPVSIYIFVAVIFFIFLIYLVYIEMNARIIFMEETNKSLKDIAVAVVKISNSIN